MGNWTLVIEGTGPHHNGKPEDVERLAAGIVKVLEQKGHYIEAAHVVTGKRDDITTEDSP